MPIFTMPVLLMIEADSASEAQKAIDDWSEEIELDNDLPVGTEDIDTSPNCENNDEGQRVLYLPVFEEDPEEDEIVTDDDDEDDFNEYSPS